MSVIEEADLMLNVARFIVGEDRVDRAGIDLNIASQKK